MFRVRDGVIRVEHSKTISRMLSWSFSEGNLWIRDNLESIDCVLDLE